jgi:hypothetical protein
MGRDSVVVKGLAGQAFFQVRKLPELNIRSKNLVTDAVQQK